MKERRYVDIDLIRKVREWFSETRGLDDGAVIDWALRYVVTQQKVTESLLRPSHPVQHT